MVTDYSVAKYYQGNRTYFSKDTVVATHSSFIMPKGSPLVVSICELTKEGILHCNNSPNKILQARFSPSIMWLRDTGILNKMKFDVLSPKISVPMAKVRLNQPLILKQLGIIMIILIVGLTIALIMFIMELRLCRKKNQTLTYRQNARGKINVA